MVEGHKTVLEKQAEAAAKQVEFFAAQIAAIEAKLTATMEAQLITIKAKLTATMEAQLTAIEAQLTNMQISSETSPSQSYAAIARTPPNSHPSNVLTLPTGSLSPSVIADTLYCTIDTSRVEEKDMNRTQPGAIRAAVEAAMTTQQEGEEKWRCIEVTNDPRNTARIRVTCRTEKELQTIKEVAQKVAPSGARVMKDQLYPIKIDNVNRVAILNQDGSVREGAAETFGKENKVHIAKMAWLSNRDTAKAYGSMVIYVTKGSEATRLLQESYFNVEGESAFTRPFERRDGPVQCFNCQAIGHKAFSCKKVQRCAKCSKEGHRHSECIEEIAKCVPCGGPHESFSRNCSKLHPRRIDQIDTQKQLNAQLSFPVQTNNIEEL